MCGASGSESSQALFSFRECVPERQGGGVSRGQEQGVRRGERVSRVTGNERSPHAHLWDWPTHVGSLLADDCGFPWLGVPECTVTWSGQEIASVHMGQEA